MIDVYPGWELDIFYDHSEVQSEGHGEYQNIFHQRWIQSGLAQSLALGPTPTSYEFYYCRVQNYYLIISKRPCPVFFYGE